MAARIVIGILVERVLSHSATRRRLRPTAPRTAFAWSLRIPTDAGHPVTSRSLDRRAGVTPRTRSRERPDRGRAGHTRHLPRLGHGSPVVTLSIYGHMFARTDEAAAGAIDAALPGGKR